METLQEEPKSALEEYLEILDSVSEAIIHIDWDGTIKFLNKAWEVHTGYSIKECIGIPFIHFIHPADHAEILKSLYTLHASTEHQTNFEIRFLDKDFKLRWAKLTLCKKVYSNGALSGFIATMLDRTEQKMIEMEKTNDLYMARRVQLSILPPPHEDERMSIIAYHKPSEILSGDMYCWFKMDEHTYGIMLIDVMGHGVSSSLICMSVGAAMRDLVARQLNVVDTMQELNRHMVEFYHTSDDDAINHYFTAIYALVNTENQTVEYVNAGHNPGFWMDETGLRLLDSTTCPIGLFTDIPIEKKSFSYEGHAIMGLCTDGFYDAMAEDCEEAEEQMLAYLQRPGMNRNGKVIKQTVANLIDNCKDNRDDITVVIVELPD
ncbi:SpoIIE family protein phosphatase [Paenibacillus xanthanilyticus]|uniref:SpoIIE family protein phosphatase n=1 Tax=Paenibacillus xanthanilyticus TaxID=1783531 RepID=A0ABV8JU60_9BACL